MRRSLAFLSLLAVLLLHAHVGAQEVRRDGFWWNRLPHSSRYAYISGVSEGIALGREMVRAHLRDKSHTGLGLLTIVDRNFTEVDERYFTHATVEQIVRALNKFYFNSKNRPVPIDKAIPTVLESIKPPPDSTQNGPVTVIGTGAAQ